jgi:hypothetical protein
MQQKASEIRTPSSTAGPYIDRLHNSAGSNRDTGGLGTMAVGSLIIGSLDAINGKDGKETLEFVATSHEIKHLARYCQWNASSAIFIGSCASPRAAASGAGAHTSIAASTACANFWA